jgi:predicted nucleotidyltransferase
MTQNQARRHYSLGRVDQLSERIREPLARLIGEERLCIYATGSYGRLEAWEASDIDLFLLHDGDGQERTFPWMCLVRVVASLIETTEDMGFPPFSGDGKYLDVHYLKRMERMLGSPEDDSLNAFTARMLLLLESRPVHDASAYAAFLETVVSFYFRDFEGNEDGFLPIFLTNDVLRFWRTLTLNYEHDRFRLRALSPDQQTSAKAKSALKNYKLKCSRLVTCLSMVLHLASEPAPVAPAAVLALCGLTPAERLAALRGRGADGLIDDIERRYEAFLESVQRDEDELLAEFGNAGWRRERLTEAADLGDRVFDLVMALVPHERLRHLVI